MQVQLHILLFIHMGLLYQVVKINKYFKTQHKENLLKKESKTTNETCTADYVYSQIKN